MNIFEKAFGRLKDFEEHHQVAFAIIVILGIVLFTWGIEKILEEYIFPNRPLYGYIFAMLFGLLLLWIAKYVILHVM